MTFSMPSSVAPNYTIVEDDTSVKTELVFSAMPANVISGMVFVLSLEYSGLR